MPWIGLQCVILVVADHTHLLFLMYINSLYIDTIRMRVSIMYFKRSQVDISKLCYISVPECWVNLGKQYRPC